MHIFLAGHRDQFSYAMEKRLRPGLNEVPPEIACPLVRGCEDTQEDRKIFILPTNTELRKAKLPEHAAADLLAVLKPLAGLATEEKLVAAFKTLGAKRPTVAELVDAGYEDKEAKAMATHFEGNKAAPKPKPAPSSSNSSSSKPPPKEK